MPTVVRMLTVHAYLHFASYVLYIGKRCYHLFCLTFTDLFESQIINTSKVIDAGSTGSRLHIFEFITTSNEISCERRGSSKAWTPLAAFADDTSTEHPLNATHVAHHMLPLFDYASIIIPQEYHTCTSVTIAATAGMRLLSLQWQKAVYDALYEGLVQYTTAPLEKVPESTYSMRFTFTSLQRKDVYTLNGEREGFYGAVAANYLRGVINAELRVIVRQREDDDTGDDETALASSIEVIEEGEKTNDGLCTNKFGKWPRFN